MYFLFQISTSVLAVHVIIMVHALTKLMAILATVPRISTKAYTVKHVSVLRHCYASVLDAII